MSIGHHIKTILLATCIGGSTLLYAEVATHPFEIESGMVIYEISGGAQLTPETNLTIKGHAKLRFKEWGEIKLEEESVHLFDWPEYDKNLIDEKLESKIQGGQKW